MPEQLSIKCAALGEVRVGGGSIVEEISAPTIARVSVETSEPLDPDSLIGKQATLSMVADAGVTRHFTLVITEVELTWIDTAATGYTVVLEHPIALLRLRRDHRTFVAKSVHEIVDAVLEGASLSATWTASRGDTPRELSVQYGETDYDFLARLLEEEGIFWLCPDDEEAPELVIADAASTFTAIEGGEEVPLTGEGAGVGVHEVAFEHTVTSGAVALADYDCDKPGVDLTSRAKLDEAPAGELFEYPGRYATQGDGSALAKLRAEEIASAKVRVTGTSSKPHLRAGSWFELTAARDGGPTGKLLVRRVEHSSDDTHAPGGERYRNSFVASPFDLPFRPRRATPRPVVGGALSATVTGPSGQEIHTDKLGRMKALYAFDRLGKNDDTASPWIRVAQPAIGGSMMLARVGWEMAIRHLDGDPDRPVAVARMYDGEHAPPEKLPGAQTKTSFETLTSPNAEKVNAITIDDKGGEMLFEVKAAKDLDATILFDETETIGADDILEVGKDSTVLIGDAQKITVEKDDANTAAKDAGVAVAGDRKKTVNQDETATIDGSLSTRIDGDDEESVGQNFEISAAKELLETAEGKYDVTVGGAVTAKAKKDYTVYVAGKSSEVVGAAKTVASSDGTLTESVGGDVNLTVGGAWVETVDGNRVSSAQGDMERTVGAVGSLTAAGKLQVKAKTIKITVGGAATFLGAGGIVSLSPASVGFVGMITLKGSGGVEIAGAPQMAG
ncbi:MAG: type VI secretion system tip protein VgrG [Labilithrix sp.]|nr:type VI secretion system tip protein VgrG [Labilithrix sp.]